MTRGVALRVRHTPIRPPGRPRVAPGPTVSAVDGARTRTPTGGDGATPASHLEHGRAIESPREKGEASMSHEHPPYAAYELLTGVFNLGAGALAGAIGRRAPAVGDLFILGVATQQVSRTLARDRVTSPLRRPFVDRAPDGKETPKKDGGRRAIGELLTCPYCLAPWTALALTGVYAVAPRAARAFAGIMAVATVSDFVNRTYARRAPKPPKDPAIAPPRGPVRVRRSGA